MAHDDIHEAMKAITCLYIAVDENVAKHVNHVVGPLLDELKERRKSTVTNEERNALAWLRGYADELLLGSSSPDAKRALATLDRLTKEQS